MNDKARMTKQHGRLDILVRPSSFLIRHFLCGALIFLFALRAFAAEVMPPPPAGYFNDYAHVVSASAARTLNEQLAQFERNASTQIVVAVFPKMQSDSSIEDYTVRVAQSWGVGQKGKNNGVVLFVFVQDHKMFIQTGYGNEGPIPDVTCKRIVEDEIAPHFKQGDYEGGLTAGINALMAAARGEYKGTGKTHKETRGEATSALPLILFFIFFIVLFILSRRSGATSYGSAGSQSWNRGFFFGGGSGGGWSGGGGSSGGGFSGFSGGGGSFGGGGAGGSW